MKILIIPVIALAMLTVGCDNAVDTKMCKDHERLCPLSENCPEHPECEAHEKCEEGSECEHKTCMTFDKETAAK